MRRFLATLGVISLATCRAVYCLMFIFLSLEIAYAVYTRMRDSIRAHQVSTGAILSNTVLSVYAVVFGIACWMIARSRPASKQWAIAASTILIFSFFPVAFWSWPGFLELEFDLWPLMLLGIFGIFVFSLPYQGWRQISRIAATRMPQAHP